jgi:hypothetical protein
MSAHCDFTEQTQEGDGKPDLVVRLPGDRVIIVDAKVPDLDFLGALDSADNAKRAESLAQHAAKLKSTIKALADRDYPTQFPNALDHVVLFLPAESLFSAALEGDRELIVWAAGKRILLATPASLIGLLRSVSVSWQQHAQNENAQEIAEAAREFYARVVIFTKHLEKIRAGLQVANTSFDDAAASFQTRVRRLASDWRNWVEGLMARIWPSSPRWKARHDCQQTNAALLLKYGWLIKVQGSDRADQKKVGECFTPFALGFLTGDDLLFRIETLSPSHLRPSW